jgi:hypothetical protein
MIGTRGRILALLCGIAGAFALPAQSVLAEEAARPLEFEVRPSGTVAETPDEALDRRLRQREYLFRSICRLCSRGDRFGSDAPFKPFEALAMPAPARD